MEKNVKAIFDELLMRHPEFNMIKGSIEEAYEIIKKSYDNGGKLLIAGNGGSAADSEHIVGELMKGFVKRRPVSRSFREKLMYADEVEGEKLADRLQGALPAIALTGHTALTTAYANDVEGTFSFAQQLYGYGKAGDVFLGISTSGNSRNITAAATVAKAMDIKVIALTGCTGGRLKPLADCSIVVPSSETFKIQELHLPVYHALCLMLEETYFES
ncbi:MAG: SIS domain-containing protein [Eubacteriales bacterium]|nr:SIS domain-containing protein [Eubacteriales bacterium]